ncbi:MAG: CPBP family intramembrane metalloprotease [Planctomycetaceae bacterium]|nr:CPBP family intramembrane metalloprotease [Planctomycetaceae bacterium]
MKRFAATAALFEGGLAVLAIALGWLLGQPATAAFHLNLRDTVIGLVATLPPLVAFCLCLKCPIQPLQEVARIVDELIVPLFRDCSILQLAIISALAGLGEEMLFRGVIQTAVAAEIGGPHGPWLGLLVAAMLFGLLHPMTPTYALLATLIGAYLGWLLIATGNLLVPVITHAVYDFLALLYFLRWRDTSGVAER